MPAFSKIFEKVIRLIDHLNSNAILDEHQYGFRSEVTTENASHIQWKRLIIITLGPTLFDNNNRLITLSRGYKNLHYLTQFVVTTSYMYKKQVEFSLSSLL